MILATIGTVIDFEAVPWTAIGIAFGIGFMILEVRLSKAGFVKRQEVDDISVKAGFVKREELNGLGERQNRDCVEARAQIEVVRSAAIMNRTDLDHARDQLTRLDAEHRALSTRVDEQVVKPLERIEEKLDISLLRSERHDADIDNLKGSIGRIKQRLEQSK